MALEKSLSKKERCYRSGIQNRAQAASLPTIPVVPFWQNHCQLPLRALAFHIHQQIGQ